MCLGSTAVEALLTIRPQEAVIYQGTSVFSLSASQIYRRIKAATKMAGPGEPFSAHSSRVGMAQDLNTAGAELPELMTAGRWDSPTMPAKYTEAQAAGSGAVARYHQGYLRKYLKLHLSGKRPLVALIRNFGKLALHKVISSALGKPIRNR